MLPRFGYSNMMGLDMTMPIMGHSHNSTAMPKPYLPQSSCLPLSNMEMAALLDTCDARARFAEAQVAQLMQLMEAQQQNQGLLPTGLPWPQGRSHLPTPEAHLPQRSLQQAFGGAKSEKSNPWEMEGSPASDEQDSNQSGRIERHMEQEQRRLAKKLRPKQTLRGYLEELRSEDPRCIFIVRRINKLGFRSKTALESHYSKFGKVLQVCVAHSKVKPLPNSGQTARTRPGNFGLVVMQSPAAVKKVLDKGSTHIIDGVEVSVHKYQPSGFDDEVNEEEDEKMETSMTGAEFRGQPRRVPKETEEIVTSGSTQTGGSSTKGSSHSGSGSSGGGINSGDTDDWNRQESGSSNSSLGSDVKGAQDQFLGPSLWPPTEPSLGERHVPSAEASTDQTYVVSLSHRDLQELREMLRLKSARSEADLSEILSQLQHLLEELQAPHGCLNAEKIMQATSLIQLAKQQLSLMHADCRSRMAEISMSTAAHAPPFPQIPFDASLGAPPGFGRGFFPGHSAQDR